MSKITDTLSGVKILEVAQSPINGRLVAVKDLTWGVHIQANGLTQSGGVAEYIWKFTLRELKKKNYDFKSVLILGLGGGTIAKLVHKSWPNAKIAGVDIDPIIVRMGKDYMNLDKYAVKIHIQDAKEFVAKQKHKFDLICLDMYQGDKFPTEFEQEEFMQQVKNLLTSDGIAIFNRLYGSEHRKAAIEMLKKLEKTFASVEPIYPEANVMFICH